MVVCAKVLGEQFGSEFSAFAHGIVANVVQCTKNRNENLIIIITTTTKREENYDKNFLLKIDSSWAVTSLYKSVLDCIPE